MKFCVEALMMGDMLPGGPLNPYFRHLPRTSQSLIVLLSLMSLPYGPRRTMLSQHHRRAGGL
jgi:hypothetical protein